ncbi:O-antigen ligase family protein [Algoriphagus litoralis]|uniref:O-antigen ligase family protein n=1 Tax=Algoriphagus litoralis TaxID=2202829 RepID=UPI000DB8F995|nr:O-antigen ligase family protein [Algoriphagus litoralis]
MIDSNLKSAFSLPALWKDTRAGEWLFLISIVSVFFPVKIYPAFFLISSIQFYRESPKLKLEIWSLALLVFSGYASLSFAFTFDGELFSLVNLAKLLINFCFLFFSVHWLRSRDNSLLLIRLEKVLIAVFVIILIQILVYHEAMNFRLITGSSSSGQASSLYNKSLYFWGLDDKNMFGARIALLGFILICIPIVARNTVPVWRVLGIFCLAFLSLSRTPLVALLIGVFLLFWMIASKKWRMVLVGGLLICLPFLLEKIVRVDNLTSSNDGMGIRLVYWKAFFQNFREISPLGNGFLSAPEFLEKYADFYRGEPHIHNTFLTAYLELGIIGFLSFISFLWFFFKESVSRFSNVRFQVLLFVPLLSIMMILYSGYDNDVVLYLILMFLLANVHALDFDKLKFKL